MDHRHLATARSQPSVQSTDDILRSDPNGPFGVPHCATLQSCFSCVTNLRIRFRSGEGQHPVSVSRQPATLLPRRPHPHQEHWEHLGAASSVGQQRGPVSGYSRPVGGGQCEWEPLDGLGLPTGTRCFILPPHLAFPLAAGAPVTCQPRRGQRSAPASEGERRRAKRDPRGGRARGPQRAFCAATSAEAGELWRTAAALVAADSSPSVAPSGGSYPPASVVDERR